MISLNELWSADVDFERNNQKVPIVLKIKLGILVITQAWKVLDSHN